MRDFDARLPVTAADRNGRGATVRRALLGWSPVSLASGLDVAWAEVRSVVRDHAGRRSRHRGDRSEEQLSRDPRGAGRRLDAISRLPERPAARWTILSTGAGGDAFPLTPCYVRSSGSTGSAATHSIFACAPLTAATSTSTRSSGRASPAMRQPSDDGPLLANHGGPSPCARFWRAPSTVKVLRRTTSSSVAPAWASAHRAVPIDRSDCV